VLYNPSDHLRLELPRYYCRNPRCRAKLPNPVSNPREAFCTRGCHSQFYRKHCLVCEKVIEQPNRGQRKLCKKAACRSAWLANVGFGHFASAGAKPIQETPVPQSGTSAPKTGRGWHIVAGPALTPSRFHSAAVPDGPNGSWEGGFYRRIEANNKAALKAVEREREQAETEAGGYFTEPEWREVISPDGVTCFVTRFRRDATTAPAPTTSATIVDDLEIPAFLLRRPA
jgi:hypothetical protein